MNVVITGSTGFLGQNLTKKLLSLGHAVFLLVRDRITAMKFFPGLDSAHIFQVNICDMLTLEHLFFADKNIDVLVHLAASLDFYGDKNKLHEINVEGTKNILQFCNKMGIKKIIFASSIEAIGPVEESAIPADEESRCSPVSSYGWSKREAENEIIKHVFPADGGYVILRFGNIYGPGSPTFITSIVTAIQNHTTLLKFLNLYKDTYIHPVFIDDATDGIINAMNAKIKKGIFILAGDVYITIGELFEMIAGAIHVRMGDARCYKNSFILNTMTVIRKRICRSLSKADLLAYFISGENRAPHRAYSIKKAKIELGFLPQTSLEEGIPKTITWFQSRLLR